MAKSVPFSLHAFPNFGIFRTLALLTLYSLGKGEKPPGLIHTAFYPPTLTPKSNFDVRIFLQQSDPTKEIKFDASLRCGNEDLNGSIALRPGNVGKLTISTGDIRSSECSFNLHIDGKNIDEKSNGDADDKTIIPSKIRMVESSEDDYDAGTDANIANPDAPPSTISVFADDFIFIQTDKPIYKPRDEFQFRILLLNAQSRPKRGTLDVRVFDADKNLIKLWKNVQTDSSGLFRGNLPLSYEPILGDWRIEALVNLVSKETVKKSVSFKVDEYVLPKFEVDVEVPAAMLISDANIVPIKISAKYLYGKSIQGVVSVKITLTTVICGKKETTKAVLKYNLNITDGVLEEKINLSQIISNSTSDGATVEFHVTVREKHTGNTACDVKSAILHAHKYKIKPIEKLSYHRPGFPFRIDFVVLDINGNIADINSSASIKHNFNDDPKFEELLVVNGLIHVNLTSETFHSHFIEVTFEDAKLRYILPERIESHLIHALAIYINQTTSVNNEFTVHVEVSRAVKSVNYLIVTDAKISLAAIHNLLMPLSDFDIKLNVTSVIGRNSKLFLFTYIDDEFVGDFGFLNKTKRSDADFDKFHISLSKNVASPGDHLKLIVRGQPNSAFALRGVDESLYLLNTNSDITQEKLEKTFSSQERNKLNPWSRFEELKETGLNVLTNSRTSKKYGRISQAQAIDLQGEKCFVASSISGGSDDRKSTGNSNHSFRLRSFFPETWLWIDGTTDDNGQHIENITAPDTLTSWGFTGFSINSKTGIDFASKQKLTTFNEFFITLNLPYSVVQGETLELIILIHNYFPEEQLVNVSLLNYTSNFEIRELESKTFLPCPANQVTSWRMKLKPKLFGKLNLTVSAESSNASDALTRALLVVPMGVKHVFSESVTTGNAKRDVLSFQLPNNTVPNAGSVKLTFIADIMSIISENLGNLIELPVGCGEQNMLNFAVDVVVLNYLDRTHSSRTKIRNTAIRFLEIGYQRQLNFRHDDGSFSAFGKSDASGSTWLTAYVLRYFIKAKSYVTIDDAVITTGLQFLVAKQAVTGAFCEDGKVVDQNIFGGGSSGNVSLTAYCALTLLEAQRAEYNISTHVLYQAKRFYRPSDNLNLYALALSTYVDHVEGLVVRSNNNSNTNSDNNALHLWDLSTNITFSKLLSKRCDSNIHGNRLSYWRESDSCGNKDFQREFQTETLPINIQTTAYALMTSVIRQHSVSVAREIALWLLKMQNPTGGFISSHDTVVALEALELYVQVQHPQMIHQTVKTYERTNLISTREYTITNENASVLQEIKLPKIATRVSLQAVGPGSVHAKVTWTYYTRSMTTQNFQLRVTRTNAAKMREGSFGLNISCATDGFQSNMAIMEVSLPSGYKIQSRTFDALKSVRRYGMHELRNEDTQLIIYLDFLDSKETIFSIYAEQVFLVEELQVAVVRVFDYYEPSRQAVYQYNAV